MNIALIAHDGKKPEMVAFVKKHQHLLDARELFATGTTGGRIAEIGLRVNRCLSGPIGGDAQIAAMAAEKRLDMIIFFRNPLDKHPHKPDVQMLLRICDVHNIPLATNPASGNFLIKGSFAKE